MRYKQIVDMARQAGAWPELSETPVKDVAFLTRFAALVFEQGRQEGMKQERALWELSRIGQEIEAQPAQEPMHPEIKKMYEDFFDKCFRESPPAQEPVLLNGLTEDETSATASVMGLTAQKQRPWVGLTGQEKAWIASVSLDVHDAVHRTDVKLKEKNT